MYIVYINATDHHWRIPLFWGVDATYLTTLDYVEAFTKLSIQDKDDFQVYKEEQIR